MCVYCKEVPACDHKRDACAASQGERCATCDHGSTAFQSYTPGPRRVIPWFPPINPRRRNPLKKATQAPQEQAKSKKRAS